MKKTNIYFLVLGLLIIAALPLAFAQKGEGGNMEVRQQIRSIEMEGTPNLQDVPERIQERIEGMQERIEERIENRIQGSDDKINERVEERAENRNLGNQKGMNAEGNGNKAHKFMNVTLGELIRKRAVSKERKEEIKDEFERARNAYNDAKEKHAKIRNDFSEAKGNLMRCRNESQNCTEAEGKVLEKAKEDLLKLTDRLIAHLEKVSSKVEEAENLNQTEVDEAVAKIDALIEELEEAQEKIEGVTTKEELKDIAEEVRAIWKQIEYHAFRYAERVVNSEVGQIYSRSQALATKLQRTIENLNDNRTNITSLQERLDEFNDYLSSAKEKMNDANVLFEEAKELRTGNGTNSTEAAKLKLEEAKSITRAAHDDLKEAHEILMQLIRELNRQGHSFNPEEITESDLVEVEVD